MAHPLRVRRNGMRAPLDGAVLVARPSLWANPSHPGYSRAEAVQLYEQWLMGKPNLLAQLPHHRGSDSLATAPSTSPCHADVLARLANEDVS